MYIYIPCSIKSVVGVVIVVGVAVVLVVSNSFKVVGVVASADICLGVAVGVA